MTARLLVLDPGARLEESAPLTRLGGRPFAPADFVWPACGECQRPLQFLAQLRDGEGLLLVFSCHDVTCVVGGAPGLTTNRVVRVAPVGALHEAPPPTPLVALTVVKEVAFDQANRPYDEARFDAGAFVFGQLGGEADSVSGHVPRCAACGLDMRFVASLEEGALFNFAGVQAFVFACPSCDAAELFVDDFF